MEYKLTAIVLSKKDVGEADRIYTLYSLEMGKIRALAKSVRKPQAKLAAFLENFTLGDVTLVKNQGTGKIAGVIAENYFLNLKSNLEALQGVVENVKMLEALTQWDSKDEQIFRLLNEYLEITDNLVKGNKTAKLDIIHLGFAFKLFKILGYELEVQRCASCGNALTPPAMFFSAEQGGIICANCASSQMNALSVPANAVKVLRIFFQNKLKSLEKLNVSREDINSLRLIVQDFFRWIGK